MTHNERVRARVDAFEARLRGKLNSGGDEAVGSQEEESTTESVEPAPPRVCRGCGCTDDSACVTDHGPCAWKARYADNTGICSACAPALPEAAAKPAPRPPVPALVYYIPAAGSVELYFPTLRKCEVFDIIEGQIPTLADLNQAALNLAGQDRTVHIEFRVPRDSELADPAKGGAGGDIAGYCTPVFGRFHRGFVRSAGPRLPGTVPVPCPTRWFRF